MSAKADEAGFAPWLVQRLSGSGTSFLGLKWSMLFANVQSGQCELTP
jgi:hypothetical protein